LSTFLKNSGIVAVSQIGTAVTLTIVGVITARVLGAEGKGQLALSLGTGMILAQILCMGFDRSATYQRLPGDLSALFGLSDGKPFQGRTGATAVPGKPDMPDLHGPPVDQQYFRRV